MELQSVIVSPVINSTPGDSPQATTLVSYGRVSGPIGAVGIGAAGRQRKIGGPVQPAGGAIEQADGAVSGQRLRPPLKVRMLPQERLRASCTQPG